MPGDNTTSGDNGTQDPQSSANGSAVQQQMSHPAEINRVAIRIPPFWPDKPELWFSQLEGQFYLNAITVDATKFWYVVGQLESRYAAHVEDVILRPPPADKYDTIKMELIKRLSTSQQQRIRQLLEHEEIGDRSPSQFLRHLRTLAGTTVQDEFLKTLWLNRLPSTMQAILVAQSGLTLEKLAGIADAIKDTSAPHQVAAMANPNPTPAAFDLLVNEIRKLTLQVSELSRNRPAYRQDRSRSRGDRTGSRSQSREPEVCWFHRKFGNDARNCRAPCNFHRSGNGESHH